jgi:hypothetical protein
MINKRKTLIILILINFFITVSFIANSQIGFFNQSLWWETSGNNGQNMPRWSSSSGDYTILKDMNGDGLPDRVAHYNYSNGVAGLWVALSEFTQ